MLVQAKKRRNHPREVERKINRHKKTILLASSLRKGVGNRGKKQRTAQRGGGTRIREHESKAACHEGPFKKKKRPFRPGGPTDRKKNHEMSPVEKAREREKHKMQCFRAVRGLLNCRKTYKGGWSPTQKRQGRAHGFGGNQGQKEKYQGRGCKPVKTVTRKQKPKDH